MLNPDKLQVLQYLLNNREELIIEFAEERGVSNPLATLGVVNFLLGSSENFSKMSPAQTYHYLTVIKPLLTNVPCDGMFGTFEDGTSSCHGNGFIDDENLLMAFQLDDMSCQICLYEAESWWHNNP